MSSGSAPHCRKCQGSSEGGTSAFSHVCTLDTWLDTLVELSRRAPGGFVSWGGKGECRLLKATLDLQSTMFRTAGERSPDGMDRTRSKLAGGHLVHRRVSCVPAAFVASH